MKIAVIVGRFQVPELHEGHIKLISTAINDCNRTYVLIGYDRQVHQGHKKDDRYPYSVSEVQRMMQKTFNGAATISYIEDMPTEERWWASLDAIAGTYASGGNDVHLYGSRDSFISNYKGPHKVVYVDEIEGVSGTKVRAELKEKENESKTADRDNKEDASEGVGTPKEQGK